MDIKKIYALFLDNRKIATDSRKITKGCIFFALKGTHFNGNIFAREALEKGASYAIIDEDAYRIDHRTIMVKSVLNTLQQLARYHRSVLNLPILSLTGSNGKTTTKELINIVLSKKFLTTATPGNFNNHIGVPLTLLSMNKDTEFGIVEMGANHQGEIAALCAIALPNYGLITNFGKAHLEGFGGIEGIIKGKSELYTYLKKHYEFIFYNADDPIQNRMLKNYGKKYGYSSTSQKETLHIQPETKHPFTGIRIGEYYISSQLSGSYNFDNIAMAATVGHYFNVLPGAIKDAIKGYIPANNRSQRIQKKSNTIILDAYNANPTSMKAALDHLITLSTPYKTAFLGDMLELGNAAAEEHQYIADYVKDKGLKDVYLIGSHFYHVHTHFKTFKTFEDCIPLLKEHEFKNRTILIKGSRGIALERILVFLS